MMIYWWTDFEVWGNNSTLYMLLYVIYWYDVILLDWLWRQGITANSTCICTSYIGMMLYWWTDCENWGNNSTLYMLLYVIYWYDVILMDWLWRQGITASCTCYCTSYIGRIAAIDSYLKIFSHRIPCCTSVFIHNVGYYYYYYYYYHHVYHHHPIVATRFNVCTDIKGNKIY
jgi:hypothetical protein